MKCSSRQIFELISDVDHYADLIPICRSVFVHEKSDQQIIVGLNIETTGFHETIDVCYQLQPYERIDMLLLKGPLKELKCEWHFQELSKDTSEVSLSVDFEFPSKLLAFALGGKVKKHFQSMFDEFCLLAEQKCRDSH